MVQKKHTMVRYSPVPSDPSQDGVPVPARTSRCPKLTRYKVMTCVSVLVLSGVLLLVACLHTGALYGLRASSGPASRTCALTAPDQTGHTTGKGSPAPSAVPLPKSSDKSSLAAARRRVMQRRLPVAIVIGARKAGTRALLRFIGLHPDVVTSKREPHYFDRYYEEGVDWYRRQMPFSTESQVTIEKTPNYFVDKDTPERVHLFNSSIKLMIIVRNPVERTMSDYLQLKEKYFKSGNTEPMAPFEDYVVDAETGEINKSYAPIKRSLYVRHLDRWLVHFQMSQILVVDGENIKVRPWEEMSRVESFLGLSHKVGEDLFVYNETKGFYCVKVEANMTTGSDFVLDPLPLSERCLAKSKGREHPYIDPEVRAKLVQFFAPFNHRFFQRIGVYFDWK
ncbi:heparan sulfate glucosamine 3-O-sulfotransferase 1 [Aplysia californica]|uniref:Heparan sulfate glucosamine 3-O-sulfotransferase 1 n=1 Tax=Aplysia californica TaxID=6500 RepID=A0ABM1A1C7_APLCA|nr:heparan sulfate glucosamine 3-O-sulfotransferase 1 [Aplysia californica]